MKNIEELRDKIFLLLGKHLIRFQTVEMRLKSLLALNSTIIFKKSSLSLITEPSVNNQTLGGLSKKALNSLFIRRAEAQSLVINKSPNDLCIDMNFSFNLCEYKHQLLSSQLERFVADRNFLAHHFQEKFNLSKLDECQQAIDYLFELEKKHKPFLDQFEQYCLTAQGGLDDHISFLKSNLFKTHLLFPADQMYKEIETLIHNNKKNDGWISLTTIATSINQKFPDANKKIKHEYSFKNLHDLILNSGLFLLKIEPTTKGEKILIQLNNGDATFEVIENEFL